MQTINRRKFLQGMGLIATAATELGLKTFADDLPYLTFDLHSHPGLFFQKDYPGYPGDAVLNKSLSDMKSGHLSGAFFALVADARIIEIGPAGVKPSRSFEPNEAWKDYKRQLKILNEVILQNKLIPGFRGSDLGKAFKEKQTAAFISVEGGDFLEGDAGRLDEMYNDGVRSVQLVHYHPNELGDLQTELPVYNGLSAAGKDVVRKMNKLKMVIDVAHASEETAKAIADLSDSPIILSHTMLKTTEDRPLARRTITIEHAKAIARTGGVIGAWPSGFSRSFDEFLDHTLRLVDAAGVDHVGLGTDLDGNFKPVFTSYLQLSSWIDGLKTKGLKDDEVRKIAGGNAARVLQRVLG